MQARFQKLSLLNHSLSISSNTKYVSLQPNFLKSLTIDFGHFSLKHLTRQHLLMAFNITSQLPIMQLVRHTYKKHLRLTSRLVVDSHSLRWYVLEQVIFKLFASMDLIRTFKQHRRVKGNLDLRVRHSFRTTEIKPFYDPYPDEIFLPFNLRSGFIGATSRLNYRKVMNFMRMLKVPVVLYR